MKKKIKEYKEFKLYDIIRDVNGVGVIIEFGKFKFKSKKNKYIFAIIRYTVPYESYSVQGIKNIRIFNQ